MKLPRLLFIARRFWPLVGGPETVFGNLAGQWHALGGETTVVTARLHSSWPSETCQQGVRIIRLAKPGSRFLAEQRYQHALAKWLSDHRQDFDLAYVSRLAFDANTALKAASRDRFPVVLRAESCGLTGDCHWQLDVRSGRRIKQRCFHAAAVVAPSAGIQSELIAAGYPRQRIQLIPNGVPVPRAGGVDSRSAARELLAHADPSLALPAGAPLIVFAGRLVAAKSLDYLIRAWPAVLSRHAGARLWLVGEGPERVPLADLVRDLELSDSVTFAGTFEGIDDILRAADLFVLPSVEEGLSLALLEALAAGLAAVTTDIPGNNEVVQHREHGLLIPPQDSDALSMSIIELLDDPRLAADLGRQARRRVEKEFSLDTMVQRHVQLLNNLLAT